MKTVKNRNQLQIIDSADAAAKLAIAVLVERVQRLPADDREDLYHLTKALFTGSDEERESAQRAINEILEQSSGKIVSFCVDDDPHGLDKWITFVCQRIKQAREEAEMTQEQLASATGLPQSHISRLENALHSPSSYTLEKIAKATNKPVKFFDPSLEEQECDGDE